MGSIIKSDGTVEEFDSGKLQSSLRRAGATDEAAESIAEEIARGLADNTPTHEIYSRAFKLLREHRKDAAARYSLKRAVLDFGPSGFPFETYLAELFRIEGYDAAVDRHIKGTCVEHEIDVELTKEDETVYVEAKFHNSAGFKTDLQVTLYVEARLQDLLDRHTKEGGTRKLKGMLVTNTKFTSRAVQYAECKGLELLGWEYPAGRTLHDRIEAAGLYPITALTTLSHSEKEALLAERVVLCRDVARNEGALLRAGVKASKMPEVVAEAGGLCGKRG